MDNHECCRPLSMHPYIATSRACGRFRAAGALALGNKNRGQCDVLVVRTPAPGHVRPRVIAKIQSVRPRGSTLSARATNRSRRPRCLSWFAGAPERKHLGVGFGDLPGCLREKQHTTQHPARARPGPSRPPSRRTVRTRPTRSRCYTAPRSHDAERAPTAAGRRQCG